MRGQPTSRMSSSRSSSCSACRASCSCSRQCFRKAWLVDQSVSSKARRELSIARCISAFEPSATEPRISSVAGFTFSNVFPESDSTSLPSMSILCSGLTFTASLTVVILSSSGTTQITTAGDAGYDTECREHVPGKPLLGRISDFDVAVKNGCMLRAFDPANPGECHSGGPPAPEENGDPMFTISAFVDAL